MAKLEVNLSAPDFEIADLTGKIVKLSDYRDQSNVLLVLNRGFF